MNKSNEKILWNCITTSSMLVHNSLRIYNFFFYFLLLSYSKKNGKCFILLVEDKDHNQPDFYSIFFPSFASSFHFFFRGRVKERGGMLWHPFYIIYSTLYSLLRHFLSFLNCCLFFTDFSSLFYSIRFCFHSLRWRRDTFS